MPIHRNSSAIEKRIAGSALSMMLSFSAVAGSAPEQTREERFAELETQCLTMLDIHKSAGESTAGQVAEEPTDILLRQTFGMYAKAQKKIGPDLNQDGRLCLSAVQEDMWARPALKTAHPPETGILDLLKSKRSIVEHYEQDGMSCIKISSPPFYTDENGIFAFPRTYGTITRCTSR